MKILIIFGTRPEAIKMAPLVTEFLNNPRFETHICVTGQHREMLDQVLHLFDITPDYDLNIMKNAQSLAHITQSVLTGVSDILQKITPDMVFVHGDVTTGVASALAAFYQKIPVCHIEAGLRTGNIYSPYPEEMNRKLISNLTTYHFAPTHTARDNLIRENISPDNIIVTGNTVIDALLWVQNRLNNDADMQDKFAKDFDFLEGTKRLILITGHRRENFDGGIENVCQVMKKIAGRGDVQILYPVHLNPQVRDIVHKTLQGVDNIFLIPPQDYLPFVYLMTKSYLIVTDSGGIQEEAPALGKPVLVTRDTTERPEAVTAGTVKLVGTDCLMLEQALTQLLDNQGEYNIMSHAHNPYGDGTACKQIVDFISKKYDNI